MQVKTKTMRQMETKISQQEANFRLYGSEAHFALGRLMVGQIVEFDPGPVGADL